MRRRVVPLVCLVACLAVGASGIAQEGHPLTGTWGGDWGPTATQRNHVTFVMNWDGEKVTGVINPGPDGVAGERVPRRDELDRPYRSRC